MKQDKITRETKKDPADIPQNTRLFHEMSACIENLYNWIYDTGGNLLYTTCPDAQMLDALFVHSGFVEKICDYGKNHDAPYALGTYMGFDWFAVLEKKDGALHRIHLLGPVLHAPIQEESLELFLREYEDLGMRLYAKHLLIRAMKQLPVIFQKQFGQLALMLHYCVTGEHLSYEKLHFLIDKQLDETQGTAPDLYRDIRRNTAQLLENIRLGGSLPEISPAGPGSAPQTSMAMLPTSAARIETPLRQLRDTAVIFTSQCANAAIDGGMSPEAAYALADHYIGSFEQHRSSPELTSLISAMYQDFVGHVRQLRHQAKPYSREIRSCMDYIDQHLEEKISIERLAKNAGYSSYYLSRKFKNEVNINIQTYIKQKKIQLACVLLTTTDDDLEAIAGQLGFCSRSHFSDTFHKIMCVSPSEYRKKSTVP